MNELYIGIGYLGAGLGAGLVILGAGLGIGKLAHAALEGTARQPEAGGALRTTMIIAAALIEGLGFFALIICLLCVMNFGKAG
ncbi:MAG: ATP synthase F0 subunit C [Elusimicrobia bacterium]|nr:ATP synthase F0 subunit C [Elusimicrobiota bacterium]